MKSFGSVVVVSSNIVFIIEKWVFLSLIAVSTFPLLHSDGSLCSTFHNLNLLPQVHHLKEEKDVSISHELLHLPGNGFSTNPVANSINHLFQNLFFFTQHLLHKRDSYSHALSIVKTQSKFKINKKPKSHGSLIGRLILE